MMKKVFSGEIQERPHSNTHVSETRMMSLRRLSRLLAHSFFPDCKRGPRDKRKDLNVMMVDILRLTSTERRNANRLSARYGDKDLS
jgi:hypothetical protein